MEQGSGVQVLKSGSWLMGLKLRLRIPYLSFVGWSSKTEVDLPSYLNRYSHHCVASFFSRVYLLNYFLFIALVYSFFHCIQPNLVLIRLLSGLLKLRSSASAIILPTFF
jgi:hypothetical protein